MSDPASASQLIHLKRFGYEPDRVLTRVEAARLIRRLRRGEDVCQVLEEITLSESVEITTRPDSVQRIQTSSSSGSDADRQDFWIDTCRDPLQMHIRTQRIMELYMKHGCRFNAPNHEQAQEVIEALDAALPAWDCSYPELFYKTLELNFPELRRRA